MLLLLLLMMTMMIMMIMTMMIMFVTFPCVTGCVQEPVVRTSYMRTAFQDNRSNALRVTIDEELDMSLESLQRMRESGGASGLWLYEQDDHSYDEAEEKGEEPRGGCGVREDGKRGTGGGGGDGCTVPSHDCVQRFPYAVLEFKVEGTGAESSSAKGCEALSCAVQRLARAGLLLEVPGFSKFQHATALLMPGHPGIPNSPPWFSEGPDGVTRPAAFEELQAEATAATAAPSSSSPSPPRGLQQETTPGVAKQGTKSSDLFACGFPDVSLKQQQGAQQQGPAAAAVATAGGPWFHPLLSTPPSRAELASALSTGSAAPPLVRRPPKKKAAAEGGSTQQQQQPKGLSKDAKKQGKASGGSSKAGEPRTFFANERTFLSWLNVAVLLLFTGLAFMDGGYSNLSSATAVRLPAAPTLLPQQQQYQEQQQEQHQEQQQQQQNEEEEQQQHGEGTDEEALPWRQVIPGVAIAPVALVFMVYALAQYHYRAWKIRTRESTRYDDLWGPSLLTAFLLLASVAAFAVSLHSSKIL